MGLFGRSLFRCVGLSSYLYVSFDRPLFILIGLFLWLHDFFYVCGVEQRLRGGVGMSTRFISLFSYLQISFHIHRSLLIGLFSYVQRLRGGGVDMPVATSCRSEVAAAVTARASAARARASAEEQKGAGDNNTATTLQQHCNNTATTTLQQYCNTLQHTATHCNTLQLPKQL